MKINDYSAKEIGKLFEKHLSPKAAIRTHAWTAYGKLGKKWNITQLLSKKGKNFEETHILIMSFEN